MKVFISYGKEDREAARRLYHDLKSLGCDPWLDIECLLPGMKWQPAIQKAIRDSRYFLVLLSHSCVNRKGFINKEIAQALDTLQEYPESEPYLIPVRLDECQPEHERLLEIQWVNMFPSWGEGLRQLRKVFELEPGKDKVEAITLVTAFDRGDYIHLQQKLRELSGVEEVKVLYGSHDFMVRFRTDSVAPLGN
jgi:hypothetical protein